MLDTRQLQYFAAIYDQGSIARASEHLHVAASALSHHLAQLEARFDAPLFQRKPRGMEPTAAGHRLYEHARSILRAISAAETDIHDREGKVFGARFGRHVVFLRKGDRRRIHLASRA